MLRVYQSWYDQLIDLKNELRGEVGELLYSDGSVAQTDMLMSYLCILPAVMYDVFDYTSPESPCQYFDYCRNIVRIFRHDIDNFFVLSKKVLSWIRNAGSIEDLFSLVQSDDRVIDMVEVPGDILASRHFVRGMRAYNALFSFLAKITLERDALEEMALTDYLVNEGLVRPFPASDDPAVKLIKFYLFKWLSAWSEKDVFSNVKFSSGSTANVGPDRALKVHWDPRFEEIPWRLSTIFDGIEPEPCQWSVALQPVPPELYDLIVEGSDYDPQWTSWFYPNWELAKNGRISRLLFVPKSAVSKRTISMEFSTMNFWQNGVDGSIRNCRTMPRANIDFTDQNSSRELCRLASETGEFTSVDLTAASDGITADQVWEFLSNVQKLRDWLFATRSTWTRYYHPDCGGYPDGLSFDIPLQKFAAMGSCCCFTVETLIFTAAAYAACNLTDPTVDCTTLIRVYGDDIIIPTWAYPMLIEIFDRLGWRINKEKSFSTGFFREACGAICYRGTDITFPTASRTALDILPVHTEAARHRTKNRSAVTWAEATAACEMANKLLSVGAWFTRYVYIMYLVRNGCSFLSRQPSISELQEALTPKDVEHRLDYPTAPLTIWSFSHALGEVHHVRPRCKDHLNTYLFKREKKRNRLGGKKYPYLTIIEGRGIYSSVPVDTVKRKLQPGERLALWLYSAQYTKRQPLSEDCCGRQFEEPLLVEHILAERSKGLREKVVLLSPQ